MPRTRCFDLVLRGKVKCGVLAGTPRGEATGTNNYNFRSCLKKNSSIY